MRTVERVRIVQFRLSSLTCARMVREGDLDPAHVEALRAIGPPWPPILVRQTDHQVIDGWHRVAAARAAGFQWIAGALFDGDEGSCWVQAVQNNVAHGLPLTARERRRCIGRLLQFYPDWSDRRLAEICGVSPTTVKSVRLENPADECPPAQFGQLDSRIGRDGRQRPTDRAQSRQRVLAALEAHPECSLRDLAGIAGTSPETVRRIRMRQRRDRAPQPTTDKSSGALHLLGDVRRPGGAPASQTHEDLALATCGGGLADFLRSTAVDKDPATVAALVPLGRVYEIADEARRRAAFWSQLQQALNRKASDSARYGQVV
jgi:hypothetical protein